MEHNTHTLAHSLIHSRMCIHETVQFSRFFIIHGIHASKNQMQESTVYVRVCVRLLTSPVHVNMKRVSKETSPFTRTQKSRFD